MKIMKALAAFLTLVVLIAGIPVLLIAWGKPLSLVDVEWSTALTRPDNGTILLGVFSVVGWLAWIGVAVSSVMELVAQLSHRKIRLHLPGIRWVQPLTGTLVALALAPAMSSHADEPTPPPVSHAPPLPGPESAATATPAVESPLHHYVVQQGDELWGVAQRELGDGAQWRQILASNPGMTADTALMPGEGIWLPTSTQPAVDTSPSTITVEAGDTLWDLAEEHLGDSGRWPELFDANSHVVSDPDEIDIGWQLTLPPETALDTGHEEPDVIAPLPAEQADLQGSDSQPPSDPPSGEAPPEELSTKAEGTEGLPHREQTGFPATPTSSPHERAESGTGDASAPSSSWTRTPSAPSIQPTDRIPAAGVEEAAVTRDPAFTVLGPVGGALAASLVVGMAARRQVQLLHRGVGARIPALSPSLQRFFAALVQKSGKAPPDPPVVGQTSVVVGWNGVDDIHVDLEQERCTLIVGSPNDVSGMTASVMTSLLCADWSEGVEVVTVQPEDDWGSVLEDPRLFTESDLNESLIRLQRLCSQRRVQLGATTLPEARLDPDLSGVWAPVVFVFCRPLQEAHLDRIHDCLSLGRVGVSVVAHSHRRVVDTASVSLLEVLSEDSAKLNDGPLFQPQLLNQPARHAVMSLFAAASDERTEPAPWWREDEEPVMAAALHPAAGPIKDGVMSAWSTQPENPTLLVLGTVELLSGRGERPSRAVGQCVEYCAWLLLNPGASPTAMVRELLVAETTRRSNMSRLRSWLGTDIAGNPHLPDAYSGRIELAASVSSDWERFQALLSGGVNNSSTPLLREALLLVRGMPLDGVAFQWPWANSWLSDMISMITDAAAVLADRCLTGKDYEGALWAVSQGQLAAGNDETLTVRRIQAYAQCGDKDSVDAAITQLTRAARAANNELSPDTVRRVQQALHLGMTRV